MRTTPPPSRPQPTSRSSRRYGSRAGTRPTSSCTPNRARCSSRPRPATPSRSRTSASTSPSSRTTFGEYYLSLGEYEGEHYGLPTNINLKSMIWYPVDDFEAAGYEVPDDLGRADRPERPDRRGRRHAVVRRLRERRCHRVARDRLDGGHRPRHRRSRGLRPVGQPRDPVQRSGHRPRRRALRRRHVHRRLRARWGRPDAGHRLRRCPGPDVRGPAGVLAAPAGELHQRLLPGGRRGGGRLRLVPLPGDRRGDHPLRG